MSQQPHQRHDDPLSQPAEPRPPGDSRAANIVVAVTALLLLIALAAVVALA
jgi:hypothetical protein